MTLKDANMAFFFALYCYEQHRNDTIRYTWTKQDLEHTNLTEEM